MSGAPLKVLECELLLARLAMLSRHSFLETDLMSRERCSCLPCVL